ncbi:MAG TPA: hypothetical protein VGN54_02550 [Mycobacteriales bacterium]|nr:hypothetical protein [Mycobacteriales bacterium]
MTAVLLAAGLLLTGCKSSSTAGGTPTVTVTASSPGANAGSATNAAASCPTSNTTAFAKTKFVLHAGLAFGAFHRYLYKPFRAGSFSSGAHGRIAAFVKAGLAALFIKREVRLASADVQANPTLCRDIATPLRAIGDTVSGAVDKLKGGDPSALQTANSTISAVESSSSAHAATITEAANPSIG